MRLKSATLIAAGLLAATATSAGAAGLPGLADNVGSKQAKVRPGVILYTGDGSGFFAGNGQPGKHPKVGKLHWTSWSGSSASATGANWLNKCVPNCAKGTFAKFPVTLKASRPRTVLGKKVFTRMQVTYTSTQPHGLGKSETWKLKPAGHMYFWSFPA
ncbi:MAG TPA: hypothetical protein VGI87_03620 [Solirubrobacteraceae bacterium]